MLFHVGDKVAFNALHRATWRDFYTMPDWGTVTAVENDHLGDPADKFLTVDWCIPGAPTRVHSLTVRNLSVPVQLCESINDIEVAAFLRSFGDVCPF